MVTIEDATLDDIPRMTELLAVLFEQEEDFVPNPEKQRGGLRMLLNQPASGRVFVARSDGDIVGMVALLFTVSTVEGGRVAWLEDVVVAPELRGAGVGSKLVRHVLAFARQNGVKRINLLTDQVNTGAQRFYKQLGFQRSEMALYRWHSNRHAERS